MKTTIVTAVYKAQISLQTWTNFILKDCAGDKWSNAVHPETGNGSSTREKKKKADYTSITTDW